MDTETHKEKDGVKMKAEMGVTQLQAKEIQDLRGARRR